MSQSGVIIRRNANTMVPNAYIELALKENPTAWGAAYVDNDNKLQVNSGDGMDVELFADSLKAFMKNDITFYFCNSESAVNMDDVSPFNLIENAEGEPLVVAFVEGKFPGFEKKESTHPASFFFTSEYLVPKFQSMYEMCEGNLDKLMTQLEKPISKKDILAQALNSAAITIIAANGKSLTFSVGDGTAEYPWGWVSNKYGYPMGDADNKERKPRAIFPSKSTVREPAPSTQTVPVKGVVDKPIETAGATVVKNYSIRKVKPPGHLGRADRKRWYQERIGYCPPKWEIGCEIEVWIDPDTNDILKLRDVKKMGLEAAKLPTLNNPSRNEKDVKPDHLKTEQTLPVEKQVVSEVLPLMSPTTREFINKLRQSDKVKKIIDENAKAISDPRHIKGLEEKFAPFAAQLGAKDIEECLPWSFEMMWDIAKEKPDGIACFAFTLRNMVMAQRTTIAELKARAGEPAKVEEPKTEKRSIFPSGKRSAAA